MFTFDKKDMSSKGYTVNNWTANDKFYEDESKSANITVTHNTSSSNANIDDNNVMILVMEKFI